MTCPSDDCNAVEQDMMMELEKDRNALAAARTDGDSDTILAEISFFLVTSQSAYAGSFTYQKDFRRLSGLPVSRETYRNKSLEAVESLILNELVACLGEDPAVAYFELTGEEIKTLAKAILQRNVMEEKWDGQCYYIRARIVGDSANSDAYPAILGQIQGKAKALLDARERARVAIEEVKKLEHELEGTQKRARILKAITAGEGGPDEVASRIREGDELWQMGEYKRAVSAYEAAIVQDPTSGAAFLGRGAAYFRMSEYQKAVQDFDRACELNPLDVTAHINLGSAMAKTGSYDQALDTLNHALTLDSGSFEARLNRGVIRVVHLSDMDSALRDFTEAIRLRPDDYRGYHHRAYVYARMGRLKEAIDDYDRSLERNPRSALTYYNRANATMRLGGAREAIEGYTQFVEGAGGHVGGHVNRAVAYAEIGDYEKALSDLDEAITLNPKQAKALVCRGILLYKTGSVKRAQDDWQTAAGLGDPEAKAYLGEILN
jgi:tetratricopeptide (TPR) repeat protein